MGLGKPQGRAKFEARWKARIGLHIRDYELFALALTIERL